MTPRAAINARIEIETGEVERVPGILQVPAGNRAAPAALLLHGFSSDKERLAHSIGARLATRGIVSLAIDLPLHGAHRDISRSLITESAHDRSSVAAALREADVALRDLAARTERSTVNAWASRAIRSALI